MFRFIIILIILIWPLSIYAQEGFQDDTGMPQTEDGTRILGTINPEADASDDYNSTVIDPLTADEQTSETFQQDETEEILPDNVILDPDFLADEGKSYESYNKVVIRILDKVTAVSKTYDLDIDKTVSFGSLRIRPKTCQKTPPIEEPESASFLQIWEKMPSGADEWVFSGWMFASSPSLSAMEHPVYDVWVIDCQNQGD